MKQNMESLTSNKNIRENLKKHGPNFGKKFSEETKKKMSLAKKGNPKMATYGFLGETHSLEARIKLSDNHSGCNNPFYGKKHSDETRRKMSEHSFLKGKNLPEETKRKISEAQKGEKNHMYGKHHNEKTKLKISEAHNGEKHHFYGKYFSEEHKRKISNALQGRLPVNLGIPHSNEAKDKMSESKLGGENPMYGKKHTFETIEKMKRNHPHLRKEKSSNWRGGLTENPYPYEFNKKLKSSVRIRDDFMCQLCEKPIEKETRIAVHHINYDKQDVTPKNLISLHNSCHIKTNYNRGYWMKTLKLPPILRYWGPL